MPGHPDHRMSRHGWRVIPDQVVLIGFPLMFGALFGAAIGSFSAATVERMRTKRSLTSPSECACGRRLRWAENVPIVGWLRVGGIARCCEKRIPVWYLTFEMAAAVAGATIALIVV